jgi:GT2 family glycosyltransferase
MKVAVAILNYNGKSWLEKFLQLAIERSPEAEVIVIDNASTDDSVAYLKTHFPNTRLIINSSNSGFAGGYNEGLKSIDAEYFILLNSDIEVTPNWITPIISEMDKNNNIAAAQPKVRAYNAQERFEHAGASGGFIDKWAYPFCRGRIFEATEEDNSQYDSPREVFWATGACLFIRKEIYWKMGGLDTNFFAHMEEIDLCWRIKNEGHRIMVYPESSVLHVGGGTLDYRNPRKTYLNFRNSLYTIHKNKEGVIFFFVLARLMLDALAGAKFILSGDFKHFISVIKAHFHYYRHIPTLQKQRKQIKRQKFSSLTGVLPKSIVFAHYLKKVQKFKDLNF